MSGYMTDLQLRILGEMASSKEPLVSHQIALRLNKDNTTIFNAAQLLLDKRMIQARQEYERGRKYLRLTDLGAFLAVSSGHANLEEALQHDHIRIPKFIVELRDIVCDEDFANNLVAQALGKMAGDLIFDNDGNHRLDSHEFRSYTAAFMLSAVQTLLDSCERQALNDVIRNKESLLSYVKKARSLFAEHAGQLEKSIS